MSITVYPAIDLKGGKAVRLAEGDMERATIYNDDPCAQANVFAEQGAHYIHVVDLDGAFAGASVNGDIVAEIVESFPGKVQVGGGIRDRAAIDRWLERGVWRVVLGTAALQNPELVREAAKALPGRIVVAVDALNERVIKQGAPFLGVCVGMQLMADAGEEFGTHPGLGWIKGVVARLEPNDPDVRVPHMGWNDVIPVVPHPLIVPGEAYFLHSFGFHVADPETLAAKTEHGGTVAAAIARDNLIGAQFHPEKSQAYGLAFLSRFLDWRP